MLVPKNILTSLCTGPPDKWTIFVGAGISAPSGIPTVAPLCSSILSGLGTSDYSSALLLEAGLPFELWLETLRERVDLSSLLGVFEAASPNFYHYAIATLIAVGQLRTVVTTNYDTLLEQALDHLGLQQKVDFDVYYDPQGFADIDWKSSRPRLLKLHGSIVDLDSIYATLSQVANREYLGVVSPTVRAVFGGGQHERVLVMGYSCSDHFDISPAIRSLGSELHDLLLIEHTDCRRSDWRMSPLPTAAARYPFGSAGSGHWVRAQTDLLLAEAFEGHPGLLKGIRKRWSGSPEAEWRRTLERWRRTSGLATSESLRFHVLGRLLIRANRYDQARTSFEKSLQAGERETDQSLIAQAKLNLGICHYRLGMFTTALRIQHAALKDARRWGMTKMEGQSLGNIGNVHYSANRLVLALRFQKRCLEFARRHNLEQLESNTLGNIGIVLEKQGKYAEARELNRRAERLARRIGDAIGEARHRLNIALEFRLEKNRQSARRGYAVALMRARATAQDELIAACLLGKVKMLKRRKEIERYLREALDVSRRTNETPSILECLEELGTCCREWGDFDEARPHFEAAYSLADAIDNELARRKYKRMIEGSCDC